MPRYAFQSSAVQMSRAQREDRRAAALEMIRGGADIGAIREQLGYPTLKKAQDDVNTALSRIISMPYEISRAVEVARLDGLILAHWPAARRGDMQATDRVLKIIAAKALLLGLNAPTRSEVVTMDVIESEITRLEAEVAKL